MDSCRAHRGQKNFLLSLAEFVERSVLFVREEIKCFSDHTLPHRFLTPSRATYRSSGTVPLLAPMHMEKVFQRCFWGPGWRWRGQSAEAASTKLSAIPLSCHGSQEGVEHLPLPCSPQRQTLPLAFRQHTVVTCKKCNLKGELQHYKNLMRL